MSSASIESALQVLCLVGNVLAVLRLLQLKLASVYPVFFSFLCLALLTDGSVVLFGVQSPRYFYTFVAVEPILNIFYLLIVWELFSVIFRNYAGLRSLSRWVMGVAAGVALIAIFLVAETASQPRVFFKRFMPALVKYERGVAFGVVIFIIILLYFISRYPIKLPRNSVTHCLLYSVFFLSDAAVLLIAGALPKGPYLPILNNSLIAVQGVCFFAWAILLSRNGEAQETRVRRHISPDREAALIRELNALNGVLMRAGDSVVPKGTPRRVMR